MFLNQAFANYSFILIDNEYHDSVCMVVSQLNHPVISELKHSSNPLLNLPSKVGHRIISCTCRSAVNEYSSSDVSIFSLFFFSISHPVADTITIDIIDYIYPPFFYPEEDVNITEPGQLMSIQRSFEVTTDMSPVASLLVFYIRPDGEVVADSVTFEVEENFANEVREQTFLLLCPCIEILFGLPFRSCLLCLHACVNE